MGLMRRMLVLAVVLLFGSACGGETGPGGVEELEAITYDGELTVGEPRRFSFWTHCGIEWLGTFNGQQWLLVDGSPTGQVPTDWLPHTEPMEYVVLRLELTDEGNLSARPLLAPADQSVTYETTNEPNPGCD